MSTTTPPSQPPVSPDGRWWWDGTRWVPTPAQPSVLPAGFPAYASPPATMREQVAALVLGIVWVGIGSLIALIYAYVVRGRYRQRAEKPPTVNTATIVLGWTGVLAAVLLVVAAVATPVFHNQRAKVTESSIKAALQEAAAAQEQHVIQHGSYAPEVPRPKTEDVVVAVMGAGPGGFCLQGFSTRVTTTRWYYSSQSGLSTVPCG